MPTQLKNGNKSDKKINVHLLIMSQNIENRLKKNLMVKMSINNNIKLKTHSIVQNT